MNAEPPPPYNEAVTFGGQPSGPPPQNGGHPYPQAGVHPGPHGAGFAQYPVGSPPVTSFGQAPYPPPVTTQPVVTPQGVIVEERAVPPVAVTHGKKKRGRHGHSGGWCCGYCYCGTCDCCDCCDDKSDGGDCCGDCDCGDCDCGGCDCGGCDF
ncbi:uncharacterized protein [Branchiostoma lanceolatum]|uniref:uncharacterized protein n=1 Tax=Branchiostoma lanceolatum TaxID=7740 RepID=UPI00345684FC